MSDMTATVERRVRRFRTVQGLPRPSRAPFRLAAPATSPSLGGGVATRAFIEVRT